MVSIIEVNCKKLLKEFVDFPNILYKDSKEFVPATFDDDMEDWNRKKNPAFRYCDAKAFLARRDGVNVGRIGAIYSRAANEKWKNNRLRFTQVDFIDDDEVVDALFKAVSDWAKELGCNELHGPLGFCDLDKEGMLVDGFDRRSLFFTYYNYPYYVKQMERLGFVKDVDWVENRITVPEDGNQRIVLMRRLAERAIKRYSLKIVEIKSRSGFKPYIVKFFNLVNIAYADLYGTVELNDEQIKRYAGKFLPMINPHMVSIVENDQGELVGFSVACPSMERALQKCRGRVFPIGWINILHALRINDQMNMLLMAVRPDYRGTGLNALMLTHVLDGCHKMNIKFAETGPMLETNSQIRSQWDFLEKEEHKRRRCWMKSI